MLPVLWCLLLHRVAYADNGLLDLVLTQLTPQWAPCHFTALASLHSAASHDTLTALRRSEPNCPVTLMGRLTSPSQESFWPGKLTRLVVLVHNINDFNIFLDFASEDDNWSTQAKVVLIVKPPVNESTINDLLISTWSHKYQLYNTVACLLGENSAVIYTLVKQPQPACDQPALIKLATLTFNHHPHVNFFPRKLSQLGGCPIKVANMNAPPYFYTPGKHTLGINANVVKILSQKLNFTYVLVPQTRSKDLIDTLLVQLITGILNNKIDILPYALVNDIGDITYTLSWNQASIAVPKAEFLPLWMNLIIPFKREVWLATIVTLLFESVVQNIFVPGSFWPSLTSKLGITSTYKPVYKFSSRLFLNNLFLSGIVINTAYHSALYQSLTLPRRFPDINTVDELMETNLPVVGLKIIGFIIGLTKESTFAKISERYIVSNVDPMKEVGNVIKYRNTSYLCDTLLLQYIQKLYYIKEHSEFHITKNIAKSLNVLILPPGSVYLNEFNSVIENIIQSGLFVKWEKDLIIKKSSEEVLNTTANLSTKHFTSAFYALFIGYILSFAIFVCEVTIGKSITCVKQRMIIIK